MPVRLFVRQRGPANNDPQMRCSSRRLLNERNTPTLTEKTRPQTSASATRRGAGLSKWICAGRGQSCFDARPSFRDLRAFVFQTHNTVIANPDQSCQRRIATSTRKIAKAINLRPGGHYGRVLATCMNKIGAAELRRKANRSRRLKLFQPNGGWKMRARISGGLANSGSSRRPGHRTLPRNRGCRSSRKPVNRTERPRSRTVMHRQRF